MVWLGAISAQCWQCCRIAVLGVAKRSITKVVLWERAHLGSIWTNGGVGALGLVLAAASIVLVVAPDVLIPAWPWTLSPLTARVLGAMFALSGIVGVEIAIDRRPSAARAIVQAQAIAIAGILLGLLRAGDDVAWSSPTAWLFTGGMTVVLAFNAVAAYGGRLGRRRR